MFDWMHDPDVCQAAEAFQAARTEWLMVSKADDDAAVALSVRQHEAFLRMKAADRAYVWVRDIALDRVMNPANVLGLLATAS